MNHKKGMVCGHEDQGKAKIGSRDCQRPGLHRECVGVWVRVGG